VVSTDGGKTWTNPIDPTSLVTGNAKIWIQRTSDDLFAAVYNPSTTLRYPLVITRSDDGEVFKDMRIVHPELPVQRYAGASRSIGQQYIRGISEWASDGSWKDSAALWVVYSVNKEDVWVSRIPVPLKIDATTMNEQWNLYDIKWGDASITEDGGVRLEDRDPYDYAMAQRVFPESQKVTIEFKVMAEKLGDAGLEVELRPGFGAARPVHLKVPGEAGAWQSIRIEADVSAGAYQVSLNGQAHQSGTTTDSAPLSRLAFRSGEYRAIGGTNRIAAGTDKPGEPSVFVIRDLSIR
jgi:hypothetical protein